MYTLKIQNASGELYELTHNPDQYLIEKITGLTTVRNTVNLSTAGTTAGGKFNSSHLESRNIVIYLVLCGDIEANRQLLYRIFPHDSEITVFFKNANRDVKIGARVELVDPDPFSTRERAQISLICPDPYWQDLNTISGNTADSIDHFCFPFAIDEEGMSLSDEYEQPVCSIANSGDSDIGFLATITIETDKEPVLELSETQSRTAEYLRQHYEYLFWGAFNTFDPDTMSLNLYLDGAYQTPGIDYNYSLLTVVYTDMWFEFLQPKLAGGKVMTPEILFIEGETATDLRRYYETVTVSAPARYVVFSPPAGFDGDKWNVKISWDGSEKVEGTDYEIEKLLDGSVKVTTLTIESTVIYIYSSATIECYYSSSGENVKNKTINRYTTDTTLNTYVDYILDPQVPTYDSAKDILRVYCGETQMDPADYEFVTVTDAESVQHTMFRTKNGKYVTNTITFEVIHSTEGEDIRDYTQEQIDAGFMLVDNLKLHNVSTDEMIMFPDIQFRNGDVIEVSTVPHHLHAVVLESEWMEPGTSLLYTVYENGTFFKLHPGENIIGCIADTNQDFVSAEITARQIYGGV